MTAPETLHPTPQFTRENWQDLTGRWEFDHDDDDRGLDEAWYDPAHRFGREILVPYPPESELSGIGDAGAHPVLWYGLRATITPERGRRTLLHFGAVDHAATVWCNGHLVAEHTGGMTPFTADLTAALDDSGEQVITVRVTDEPGDLSQPRGKQDWRAEPHGIFYHRTSGIWQPVWVEHVSPVRITDLAWTTDLVAGTVTCEVDTVGLRGTGELHVSLRLGDQELATVAAVVTDSIDTHTVVVVIKELGMAMGRQRLLWTPDSPTLVDATVELVVDGTGVDTVGSYLGLRSCGVADGRFLLNGHPYFLRMVLEQGYWPESHLAAPDVPAMRREIELIKELGFNGARLHQKVEDPRFLHLCDRLGLLVWGEMANTFVYTRQAAERLTREWLDVVRRDRSHPSIVAWIPLNESWGVPGIVTDPAQQHFASALYHLTRALDPTRPTVSNDGWEITEADLWNVHDYTPFGDSIRQRYSTEEIARTLTDRGPGRRRVLLGEHSEDEIHRRRQPILLTEFGGLSYAPGDDQEWFGYGTIDSPEEFLERVTDLVGAVAESPELAGFCWTQFTDTLQESNGLLTADRQHKLDPEALRRAITTPAKAIPSEEVDRARREARSRRNSRTAVDQQHVSVHSSEPVPAQSAQTEPLRNEVHS